jgi:hypothetical protein
MLTDILGLGKAADLSRLHGAKLHQFAVSPFVAMDEGGTSRVRNQDRKNNYPIIFNNFILPQELNSVY